MGGPWVACGINILDCTFRDGGYHTNWGFDKTLVEKTASALACLPVEYMEIGFRNKKSDAKHGLHYDTTPDFLETLDLPESLKLGVMVDLKKFPDLSELGALFPDKRDSQLHLVRLATVFDDFDKSIAACDLLKSKGYTVAANFMRVSLLSDDILQKNFARLKNLNADMIVLADTFGSMLPGRVSDIFTQLKSHTNTPLGFHAHNNRGLGLANVHAACNAGVTWIDATVTGMGRGAGNVALESVLLDFHPECSPHFAPLHDLIIKDFYPLQHQCGWGYSPSYHFGALKNTHPTTVQQWIEQSNGDFDVFHDLLQKEGHK